jgi:hypothetical protein
VLTILFDAVERIVLGTTRRAAPARGRAVQVDPIKPEFKPPGTTRLKLKCDDPLSNFAFKINLRRYTVALAAPQPTMLIDDWILVQSSCADTAELLSDVRRELEAGAYTRPLFSST